MLTGTTQTEALRNHLKWFLFLRVVVITSFFGAFAVAQFAVGDFDDATGLLEAIAATYAFTIASAIALKRTQRLVELAYAQLAFDILLISGAVLVTGGAGSPFTFLYSLAVLNAAILLSTNGAAVTALMAFAAYAMLITAVVSFPALEELTGAPTPSLDINLAARFLIELASFAVVAYLAGVLTQRLHDAERALDEERIQTEHLSRLQQAVAQNIGSGLVTTDPEGHVTSANQIAADLVGESTAPLAGRDIGALFAPLHLTAEARLAFLQSTRATAATEFRHAAPGEKDLLLRCSATPLKDTYDRPIGALYIFQDITGLREMEDRQHQSEVAAADAEIAADDGDDATIIDGFVGRSPAMQQIRTLIERVAPSDATVLLCGESGTGKEVAARAIHTKSPRRDKPFVAINCGAIPEHLIESELFGHVKGAFTGAVANRAGFFRAADGGTVFLDEIGELPLPMQVKLLRVLQERVFKPVGSETHVAVNVRVITATNKDLEQEVKAAHFREDLYYRLNVISIELPPLRDRPQDIPLLVRHFLRQFSDLHRKHVVRLSVGAARRMLQHAYPGNVRELANIIEHAVTMADGETVHEAHLSPQVLQPPRVPSHAPAVNGHADHQPSEHGNGHANGSSSRPSQAPAFFNGNGKAVADLETHLEEYEKGILLRALDDAGGVKKRAAELLGINYRSFRHRLSKYGLNGEHAEADA